ncbi:protein Barley B recombinant-like [Zingiber officinale]|nr:protein Barley B recombinant-like [Zingiber officinale]XP_042439733.1 protein Barley B recombinant-like [Zingiber officinale]
MDDEDGLGIRNWGYYEPSLKGNLGLRLMPSVVERDVKPLMGNSGFIRRHCATPEPSLQMDFVRDGWNYHNFDNGKNDILRDGWNHHSCDISKNELLRDGWNPHGSEVSKNDVVRDGWFHQGNDNGKNFHILPMSHLHHPTFGFAPEPPTMHNLQMLQHQDPQPKDDRVSAVKGIICSRNESPTKKRSRGRQPKSPKSKKPKKVTVPNNEVPNGSLSHGKAAKKNTGMVINGIDFDISRIPTPVCSCTGKPQQCYRWGVGGWQSACCTTSISMHPLPMNTKRRGARIAGRKMSQGAFKKVLEKLAGEGYNLSNPIDLRTFWAKHGTNKFVTIR